MANAVRIQVALLVFLFVFLLIAAFVGAPLALFEDLGTIFPILITTTLLTAYYTGDSEPEYGEPKVPQGPWAWPEQHVAEPNKYDARLDNKK